MQDDPAPRDGSRAERIGLASASLLLGLAVVPLIVWPGIIDPYAAPKLAALSLVLGVAGAGMAAERSQAKMHRAQRLAAWAVVVFLAWNCLSFLVAGPDAQGFYGERYLMQGLWSVVLYAASWLMGFRILGGTRRRLMLLKAATVGTAGVAVVAIVQVVTSSVPSSGIFAGRATSTIGQPNSLGAFLAMGVPLALALALVGRTSRERFAGAAAAVLAIVGVVMSGSRGALLGLAVAGVASLPLLRRRLDVRLGWRAAIAVIATVVALFSFPGVRDAVVGTASRVVSSDRGSQDASVRQHLDLWAVAARIVADHPLLGIGPERFPLAFPDYRDVVLSEDHAADFVGRRAESPHDVYLAVAVAGGLPALALYLLVIGVGLAGAFGRRLQGSPGEPSGRSIDDVASRAMGLAILAHLVTDLFMSAELSSSWLGWLLLGAATGGLRGATRDPDGAVPDPVPGQGLPVV